ncbi:MAG: glycerol-3-phosphate 1-O-acyltransferase PlsY [Erysipelotrichaceae bacterium]|nr:glycerol-3-phosphate 1-O-acyltransferase PlsY [Erysipelotrichaceae bacterium]
MISVVMWVLIAYLIGSIPWGLVIGKVFYHKDIREYGSGNLGGTNAGRVFGTPVGMLVIVLDALKAFIVMTLIHFISPGIEQYCGLAVCIGHCFPVFAQFKGGKAVACAYGYLLGLAVYVTHEYFLTFFLPIIVFFIVLAISRMVSLSSMCGVSSAAVIIFLFIDKQIGLLVGALALFVIYRHRANIERIKNGTESKIGSGKNNK